MRAKGDKRIKARKIRRWPKTFITVRMFKGLKLYCRKN
jgi:hypothetical protein